MKPSIQFVKRKDGVRIAYSKFGEGQPLVMPPPWVTSLAFVLEDPFSNQFIEQLARKSMVIYYDKHGCGQSDRNRKEFRQNHTEYTLARMSTSDFSLCFWGKDVCPVAETRRAVA